MVKLNTRGEWREDESEEVWSSKGMEELQKRPRTWANEFERIWGQQASHVRSDWAQWDHETGRAKVQVIYRGVIAETSRSCRVPHVLEGFLFLDKSDDCSPALCPCHHTNTCLAKNYVWSVWCKGGILRLPTHRRFQNKSRQVLSVLWRWYPDSVVSQ